MEACCCCNAPGSQMSWCGSDLRLSLGIEPPVAIWGKGGHVAEHRDRRILWQRTRERFANEMAATKADGRRKQQRGAVDQGTVTEREWRSTSQNTQADQRRQPGNTSTSRHSSARSSINSLLTCWSIERRFDPTSNRYSLIIFTINFISGLSTVTRTASARKSVSAHIHWKYKVNSRNRTTEQPKLCRNIIQSRNA